jgi:hypothetical protein
MSTSSATIRSVFQTAVFDHATIQAQTENIFSYDIEITTDKDLNNLRFNQEVNFYSYQVLRTINYEITSMNGNPNDYGYDYQVLINYYLEAENKPLNYNSAIDRMEALEDLIHSELTINWSNNVDSFSQTENTLPEIVSIQDIECWKITSLYTGLKYN